MESKQEISTSDVSYFIGGDAERHRMYTEGVEQRLEMFNNRLEHKGVVSGQCLDLLQNTPAILCQNLSEKTFYYY
jgi:hypothetical protein